MWRMTWDELLAYCLAKPGAWQDEPWGDGVVAKVGPKIFAFLGTGAGGRPGVGLKCGATREAADEWLLRYPGDASVMPYIGRSGWNNLTIGRRDPRRRDPRGHRRLLRDGGQQAPEEGPPRLVTLRQAPAGPGRAGLGKRAGPVPAGFWRDDGGPPGRPGGHAR